MKNKEQEFAWRKVIEALSLIHIFSVFKLIQDLLAPSPVKNRSLFQLLMDKLPPTHKAKWFAGAALNSADQAMASVLSLSLIHI